MSYVELSLFLKGNLKLGKLKKSSQFRIAVKCESSEAVELSEGGEKTQNRELENLSSGVDLVPHLPSCD